MNKELYYRIISSVILFPITIFLIIKGSIFFNFLLLITLLISFFEWHSLSKKKSYNLFGFIFLLISFYSVYKLRIDSDNSFWTLLIITLICILTDLGGYIFGKLLKGPKLTKYSPNKTYSGLFGGYLMSLILIPFLVLSDLSSSQEITKFFIFILLVSTISQFGDITISFFKRISKIKDTGKIIPGHGGLLD